VGASLSNVIDPISPLIRKDAIAKLAIKQVNEPMLPKVSGEDVLKLK
jgi:hypothetical protein